jgi:tetratricopeptide (TPR) repeat protein
MLETSWDGARTTRLRTALALLLVAAVAVLVFLPTRHNGFLEAGFDDQLILDDPNVRQLDGAHLWSLLTTFRHANYVPLTMLTFALQYPLSGDAPADYHLVNVLLHAASAVLLWLFVRPLVRSTWTATLAALLFAVHPLQLEAVSLAIQRKTLLSTLFVLLALIAYQRWCARRSPLAYAASLLAFVAAAAAKPTVVTLPLLLLLYDYVFVGGRLRLLDKLPFFAVAEAFALAAVGASRAVGAIYPPHGGSWPGHVLVVARALADGAVSLVLPFSLSPIYYYRAGTQFDPLNVLALAAIVLLLGLVTVRRRQYPWAFFCVWWFVLCLLPQSNIFPLAQLRPDRYVYLSLAGFALGVAVALDWVAQRLPNERPWRLAAPLGGALFAGMLASVTVASIPVWHDDVSAWQRVIERNPWCAIAHMMLGRVYDVRGDAADAEQAYLAAIRVQPQVADPYLHLARLYAARGEREQAQQAARAFLERAPNRPEAAALSHLSDSVSRR